MTFYNIIRFLLPAKFFEKKLAALEKINPDRFYVENIRSYYGMTTFVAQRLCDEAVNDGKFDRKIGLVCPKCSRIIQSFSNPEEIKQIKTISCEICEANEEEVYEYSIEQVQQVEIYSLHR
jgi:hypothetical protein